MITGHLLTFANLIDKLCKHFAKWAAFFTLALLLLTVQQVIARYFFGKPSIGLQELEWHLFGAIFLLGSAYTLKKEGHVRVDLIYGILPRRGKAFINCMGLVLFLLPSAVIISIHGFEYAMDAREYTSSRPNDYYSSAYFEKDSLSHKLSKDIESLLRNTILVGEISADPGGLEARWIVKFLIPFGFILLALQALSLFIREFLTLLKLSPQDG